MKTKKFFMGLSIFGIAILGAYASSVQEEFSYRMNENDASTCTSINVGCSNQGLLQCKVISPQGVRNVWQGTLCSVPVYHNSDIPLEPNNQ